MTEKEQLLVEKKRIEDRLAEIEQDESLENKAKRIVAEISQKYCGKYIIICGDTYMLVKKVTLGTIYSFDKTFTICFHGYSIRTGKDCFCVKFNPNECNGYDFEYATVSFDGTIKDPNKRIQLPDQNAVKNAIVEKFKQMLKEFAMKDE